MPHVFISYVREDLQLVDYLVELFKNKILRHGSTERIFRLECAGKTQSVTLSRAILLSAHLLTRVGQQR